MFRSPQQHQIEHVIPIPHDVVEEPLDIINQEESNIRDEDNQFVNSNVNQKKHGHNISIRIDRRISMGSDEMREIIENTDEIEINRPIYEPISNQPNFYEPSIPSSNYFVKVLFTNHLFIIFRYLQCIKGSMEFFYFRNWI